MQSFKSYWNNENNSRFNYKSLPKSIRGIIVGQSGCGKTACLIQMLLSPGFLDYDQLYIYGKSLHQPEYQILRKCLENKLPKELIIDIFERQGEVERIGIDKVIEDLTKKLKPSDKSDINIELFEDSDDIPDPKDVPRNHKNLFIFDDILLEKQTTPEKFYTRGRHNNIDTIYIAQNFHKLPRQTIRANHNLLILFKQPHKDLRHIFDDLVSNDMNFQEFKDFANQYDDYKYVVIDKTKNIGKYKNGFNEIYIPQTS